MSCFHGECSCVHAHALCFVLCAGSFPDPQHLATQVDQQVVAGYRVGGRCGGGGFLGLQFNS